jgi:hypothetical protein
MENKDLLKSPLFLIIATGILILILYFIISPYQNCMRDEGMARNPANGCIRFTSW